MSSDRATRRLAAIARAGRRPARRPGTAARRGAGSRVRARARDARRRRAAPAPPPGAAPAPPAALRRPRARARPAGGRPRRPPPRRRRVRLARPCRARWISSTTTARRSKLPERAPGRADARGARATTTDGPRDRSTTPPATGGRRRDGRERRRRQRARRPARPRRRRPAQIPNFFIGQLRDPAVPAVDLPGGGHPVRRPVGGPGRDQRDRDRLRPQPQRLHGRCAGLDAVHARQLAGLRRRRQRGRPQGPLQPRRRDLRRRALPEGGRRRGGPRARRSSPTTTPTGTSTRCCARARFVAGLPSDLVGSLTGLAQGRSPVAARVTLRRRRSAGRAGAARPADPRASPARPPSPCRTARSCASAARRAWAAS